MTAPLVVRIFLCSPGDVADERGLAFNVIRQLGYDELLRGRVKLEVIAWDKEGESVPMLATMTPQEAIDLGLPRPSECDIVIVIFWSRIGTPLTAQFVKPDGSAYQSGTEWEYLDAFNAARRSTARPPKPHVLVYRRMEKVLLDPEDPEFDKRRDQYQRVRDFFSTFTNADESINQGHNAYQTPEDFRVQLESHLKFLLRPIAETLPAPEDESSGAETDLWPESPFPGLRPFGPEEAPIYFGRGRETDALVARLTDPTCRFLCVIGASGSGKSSLVGAGLLPRLADNAVEGSKDWAWVRFTPGSASGNPFVALANAVTEKFPALAAQNGDGVQDLADALAQSPDALIDLGALADRPAWSELLLFIDQFEELFTLVDEPYRQPFVDLLDGMTKNPRLRIVATVRADFYHDSLTYPKLADWLNEGSYSVPAPSSVALADMIERPAQKAGLDIEPGLIETIRQDLGTNPGALPLMAYTLDELYKLCKDSRILTNQAYKDLGGVQQAIGVRAEQAYNEAYEDEKKKGQDALSEEDFETLAQAIFDSLVEISEEGVPTRKRVRLSKLTTGETGRIAVGLIDKFTRARLLTPSKDEAHDAIVDVAHEALLTNWVRMRDWIDETKEDRILLRQVQKESQRWHTQHEDPAHQWSHDRLVPVYRMLERRNKWDELDDVARRFIRLEAERLKDELNGRSTTHRRRRQIGERLNEIWRKAADVEDANRRVLAPDLIHLINALDPAYNRESRETSLPAGTACDADNVPDMQWCEVPGGVDSKQREIQPFWIARYPVTYGQYRAFVERPDGYDTADWWQPYPQHRMDPGEQYQMFDNYPADNVSWHDAIAFCRWLTALLRDTGRIGGDAEIRLPFDWEWEQAASGGDPNRKYPWGPKWNSALMNSEEARLDTTVAVGMYPGNAAPCGALDMYGNVFEWCLNRPEMTRFESLNPTMPNSVALRGGCFARKYTTISLPEPSISRTKFIGFRVVWAAV